MSWSVSVFDALSRSVFEFCFLVFGMYGASYFLRKVSADFQARVGPREVGGAGLAQPLADFGKLLRKRITTLKKQEKRYYLSYLFFSLSIFAIYPLQISGHFQKSAHSFLLILLVYCVLGFLLLLKSLPSGSGREISGVIRVLFKGLLAGFVALICFFVPAIETGAVSWIEFSAVQRWDPLGWIAFKNVFSFFAFILFLISGAVICGERPFDTKEDLTQNLSGGAWLIARIVRNYLVLLWGVIAAWIFLGAEHYPFQPKGTGTGFVVLISSVVLISKSLMLISGYRLISLVLPSMRIDQVTSLIWKLLFPGAIICVVGVIIVGL